MKNSTYYSSGIGFRCETIKNLKKVKIDEKLEIVDFLQNEELLDLDFTGRGKITSEKILSEFIYDFIKEGCGCIF